MPDAVAGVVEDHPLGARDRVERVVSAIEPLVVDIIGGPDRAGLADEPPDLRGENEVVAYGLSRGQRIVTAGTSRLHEGAAIRVVGPSGLGASPVEREPAVAQAARPR